VLDAWPVNTLVTAYIITRAEPPYTFFVVTAAIEGIDQPLSWGKDHLQLVYEGRVQELVSAHGVADMEGIRAEKVFVWQVRRDSDFAHYELQVVNGPTIPLGALIETAEAQAAQEPEEEREDLGTVGGGLDNEAGGRYAIVGGGSHNLAGALEATVSGGSRNVASAAHATIGGGSHNTAGDLRATIGGGYGNVASDLDTTVGGGGVNRASASHATVGGGSHNTAEGRDATVAGGLENRASDDHATISGGARNAATGFGATIGGGGGNVAADNHATVGGGLGNRASGIYGTVSGGQGNTAAGAYASVPGGLLNEAAGDYSWAAGQRARVSPQHPGAFLYADSQDADFASQAADEFAVRAGGGVRFVTATDAAGNPAAGVVLAPGSGSWSSLSDRQSKENIAPVAPLSTLARLASLPIATWNYASQDAAIRHLGPMAQDFQAAFGLGESNEYISAVDADGVALAAIQDLYQVVQDGEQQAIAQQQKIDALAARLAALEETGGSTDQSLAWFLAGLSAGWLSLAAICWIGIRHWRRSTADEGAIA
jgi:hypothetical protein